MSPTRADDLQLARQAAQRAAAAVLQRFRQDTTVEYKAPDQPVTVADLSADRILREALQGARPAYGWLSEETADSGARLDRSRVWIVDPIDGTNSFVEGRPEFVVSIGLVEDGTAVLGVVLNPATGELYHAERGGGAWLGDRPIRVRPGPAAGERGVMLASRSELQRGELDGFRDDWSLLPLGSTAYRIVKVADGTGQIYLSRGRKREWDVCAAALVLEEAGGRATQLDGAPLRYNRPEPVLRGIIASNGSAHERLDPPGEHRSRKEEP